MGWAVLAALALIAAAALWFGGFPRRLWTIPATALTLGAAGYAWQGSPGLAGHSVTTAKQSVETDQDMIDMRDAMFGRFDMAYRYLGAADAMTRIGSHRNTVKLLQSGVAQAPKSPVLWTWLGIAIADSDGGLVTPASKYAFDQAMLVAPDHPGPPYFYGLALVRSGQIVAARPWWVRAVELTPEGTSYRPDLVAQLGRMDGFLRDQGVAVPAGPEPSPSPTPAATP